MEQTRHQQLTESLKSEYAHYERACQLLSIHDALLTLANDAHKAKDTLIFTRAINMLAVLTSDDGTVGYLQHAEHERQKIEARLKVLAVDAPADRKNDDV